MSATFTDAEVDDLVTWANDIDSGWTPDQIRLALDEKKRDVRAAQALARRAEERGRADERARLMALTTANAEVSVVSEGIGSAAALDVGGVRYVGTVYDRKHLADRDAESLRDMLAGIAARGMALEQDECAADRAAFEHAIAEREGDLAYVKAELDALKADVAARDAVAEQVARHFAEGEVCCDGVGYCREHNPGGRLT